MIDKDIFLAMKTCHSLIKNKNPLILNLTNQVTMQWVADVQSAMHASPIMSTSSHELEDIINKAHVLYINIGTLNDECLDHAFQAARLAKEKNILIVLDPVGCGFTSYRTKAAVALAPYATVIRGNASEVMALSGQAHSLKGVDSTHSVQEAKPHAIQLAKQLGCVVITTGQQDFICSTDEESMFSFGSPMMRQITGMGCALGGVIAAFLSVTGNTYQASLFAIVFYTLSASFAAIECSLGQFPPVLIDALYAPDWEALERIFMRRGSS
jgi:hydroxyethylthiazole kinase